MHPDPSPYDALLLVSFGGPEKPDDVVPFLENVTRGRGIPRERLETCRSTGATATGTRTSRTRWPGWPQMGSPGPPAS